MDDPLCGMDALPWDRIPHWFGRAGDIPPLIRALGTQDCVRAADELRWKLEHQYGIVPAARAAVPFICAMLRAGRSRDPLAVIDMLRVIERAARDVLADSRSEARPPGSIDVFAPETLWPPYSDEAAEDDLWGAPVDNLAERDATWALDIETELAALWRTLPAE